jgi:hypothetical protein
MAENIQRSAGRSQNYKFDRGGVAADPGPFTGIVMNNIDPTRSGRLQVYIEQLGNGDKNNKSQWRTVSYCPPFYGATPQSGTSGGTGTFSPGNQMSYGMWFSPPDVGVTVICFFVAGDPNQGYYLGVIPDQSANHMVPAIGAVANAAKQNTNQDAYFANSPQLPVTEINTSPANPQTSENPKYFNQEKPVHSYQAGVLFQQGLVNDPIRGTTTSSSQRESPSSVFGFSSPGRAIYNSKIDDATAKQQASSGQLKEQDVQVTGRRGGHSFVMDDGDQTGKNNMLRMRSAKGHQVMLSDDGNCIYISHANGQTWLEFGQEGTLDVYSTNSINFRTEGEFNVHADKDINMFAGGNINMKSMTATTLQSEGTFSCANKGLMNLFSEAGIGVKSNGTLGLKSQNGGWDSGGALALDASGIDLNGGLAASFSSVASTPKGLTEYTMPNSQFDSATGWAVSSAGTKSIVTRAPSHEPWPYHNQGVQVSVTLSDGNNATPPGAPTVPAGTSITKTS